MMVARSPATFELPQKAAPIFGALPPPRLTCAYETQRLAQPQDLDETEGRQMRTGQIQGGTLPRLSQTGEGFLLELDFAHEVIDKADLEKWTANLSPSVSEGPESRSTFEKPRWHDCDSPCT